MLLFEIEMSQKNENQATFVEKVVFDENIKQNILECRLLVCCDRCFRSSEKKGKKTYLMLCPIKVKMVIGW